MDDTAELRQEFLRGAALLGLELVDLDDAEAVAALEAMDPPRRPLQPQQLFIADVLNAQDKKLTVEIPRRASKTTSILAWCLGRLVSRRAYKVTYSAQTGLHGIQALDEWARDLDAINPPDWDEDAPWKRHRSVMAKKPKRTKAETRHLALFGEELVPAEPEPEPDEPQGRTFRILRGNTKAGIYFDNGSVLYVVKPEGGAFRGKAGDVNWVDEAQEIEPEDSAPLLAGIMPLQDTRKNAKLILSGTAGEVRSGAFWNGIAQLRAGDPEMGGIDFAVDPKTDWELLKDEDSALALLAEMHPGIGTLTTMEIMRDRYRDPNIPLPQWAREYLSLWPETFGISAIPAELIDKAQLVRWTAKPARKAFGYDVKPNGAVAAIVAAWRNPSGVAYIEIVAHQSGTTWMPKALAAISEANRGATTAYDDLGEGGTTATETMRLRPRPRLQKQTYQETAKGCVQLERDLERGTLRYPASDTDMTHALSVVAKRETKGDSGVWLFTSPQDGTDVTVVLAAVRALRNWDQHFAQRANGSKTGIITAGD